MKSEKEPMQPDFCLRKALVAQIDKKTLIRYDNITLRDVHPDNLFFPFFLYGINTKTGENVTIRLDDNHLPSIFGDRVSSEITSALGINSEIREIEQIETIDSKIVDMGFNPEVVKDVRQLVGRLELPKNAKVLFLGPGATPLQFLLAGDGNLVDIVEKSEAAHQRIAELVQGLDLKTSVRLFEEENRDVITVALEHDAYDIIFAINILDLVGEKKDVYLKMLLAIKDKGKIAIGHFDTGIGSREQNNLDVYAQGLGYGLEDLQIIVDEGHQKTDQWYSDDSTLFRVFKENIPERARGKELSSVADVIRFLAGLK
ncbi:MAG: hypothetical protein ABIJ46_00495 [bacterium]